MRGERPLRTLGALDPGLYMRNREPSRAPSRVTVSTLQFRKTPDSLRGRTDQSRVWTTSHRVGPES